MQNLTQIHLITGATHERHGFQPPKTHTQISAKSYIQSKW